jgi:diguanylate cyclase (GGDEF)-like protein/PAS domain S-box-containing protein
LAPNERALLADERWLERVADAVTVLDTDGRIRATNGELKEILGYPRDAWVGRDIREFCHPDDLERAAEGLRQLLDDGLEAELHGEFRVRHADGHWETVEFEALQLADGEVTSIVIMSRTVTEHRRNTHLLTHEAAILDRIASGDSLATVLFDVTRLVEQHAHEALCAVLLADEARVLRVGAAPTLPRHLFEAVDGLAARDHDGWLGRALLRAEPVIIADVAAEDSTAYLAQLFEAAGVHGVWAAPITHPVFTEPLGVIACFYRDVGGPGPHEAPAMQLGAQLAALAIERERVASHLDHLAEHDLLTGLPNRVTLTRELNQLLARPRPVGGLAAMFLDIDAFNVINDSLGHRSGDVLLKQFADRVRSLLPSRTLFARFGGDEFVVVLERADVAQARQVTATIDDALRRPFNLEGHEVFLSASIGVATVTPGREATADTVLRNADAAMYQAKRQGRGGFVVFDDDMRTEVVDRLHAESRLRHALERHEFTLVYQPKIDLRTGFVRGAEALLRWNHPERGLVGPDEVIPWAESTGLIVPLGTWVLETAVRQAAAWADAYDRRHFLLAVNVSARQLAAPVFANLVGDVLARCDWPADALALEITESVMLEDTELNLRALEHLKSLGVRLAIDDFGTGYSSLSYLHRFPIDIVKVDRAFVEVLAGDESEPAIATAVVAMAEALGLTTAAEGIETTEQLDAVRQLGCDWGQGFLFARPLPPDEFEALLRRRPTW